MTEKDAVKCAAFADERCWYVPVTADFEDSQGRALVDLVIARVNAFNAKPRPQRNNGNG
jgi:tetraacyldisaccharide 4'-kinase